MSLTSFTSLNQRYSLILTGFQPNKKLITIKGLTDVFDMRLVEAKNAAEHLPYELAKGLTIDKAEQMKSVMEKCFAYVEIVEESAQNAPNAPDSKPKTAPAAASKPTPAKPKEPCPVCGSESIKSVTKNDTSFFGKLRGKTITVNTCPDCGYEFESKN